MANPYMEYPDPNKVYPASWNHGYQSELTKYHSGLLPFERKDLVIAGMFVEEIAPDTLIPVDLEAEVVEQWQAVEDDAYWCDIFPVPLKQGSFRTRKVLRIKP